MMKVLLFSRSRVVREMVRLAAVKAGSELEFMREPGSTKEDRYDLLLIDEEAPFDPESLKEHLIIGATVLIHSPERVPEESYDYTVSKPFLPSDILRLMERSEVLPESDEPAITLEDFVAGEEEETQVLDAEEIARIRALLSDDLVEESFRTEARVEKFSGESTLRLEGEELIDRLFSLKLRKMKKLLKGAEVTITLRFPKEGS